MNRILIVNGIDDYKDLSDCGIKLAKLYQESDIIYTINRNGEATQNRFIPGEDIAVIKYFDVCEVRDGV